jgi:S-DNA-T family DNA segregation ATPase FtsK/SpoIIIE
MAELRQVVRAMDAAWQGTRPDPIGVLRSTVPLAEVLRCSQPPAGSSLAVALGEDALRLEPVVVNLVRDGPHFLVAGTGQSGKTTLLLTWVLALATRNVPQDVGFCLICGRRGGLAALAALPHVIGFWPCATAFLRDDGLSRLRSVLEERDQAARRIVVMIDDYDELIGAAPREADIPGELARLTRRGLSAEAHFLVAGPLPNLGVGYGDALVKQLKTVRSGFLLRAPVGGDQNPFGLRVRSVKGEAVPPGRGYVVRGGCEEAVQVATPGDAAEIEAWVQRLVGKGGS